MVINLKSKEQLRTELLESIKNSESPQEQSEKYSELIEAITEEIRNEAIKEVKKSAESGLTAKEHNFFTDISNAKETYDHLLPEETVDRVFEDLIQAHPLLDKIGLKKTGVKLQFITSTTEGKAVWGQLFGSIKGQLKHSFPERKEAQDKLTAYVVIPKDAIEFGPKWIEKFVRAQLVEAFSVALEEGFLNGDGNDKPIGLSRKLNGVAERGVTTYPKKEAQAQALSFENPKAIIDQVAKIFEYHSLKEDGETFVDTDGKVFLVVNPTEAWKVKKLFVSYNADGDYKTSIPFDLQIIPSLAQEKGYATSFVTGRYDAFIGGEINLQRYRETLALEDMDLFIGKDYAYGKAHDEKAAAVWSLDFSHQL